MISASLRFIIAGLISLILYGVAVGLVFASHPQHQIATALLLTCFFCCVFLLFTRALEPIQSFPTMFCMMYFSFFYLLPGSIQISSVSFQVPDVTYSEQVSTQAALIATAFLLCFFIGQALVNKSSYQSSRTSIEKSESYPRVIPIAIFSSFAVMLGVFSIAHFGLGILLSTRGEINDDLLRSLSGSDIGLLLLLPRAMALASSLLLIYAMIKWRKENFRACALIAFPLIVIMTPIFFIVNFPLALARNWQFGILLSFMIVFIRGWRPWLRVGLIVGMILTMFSLFQWLNVLRQSDISSADVTIESPIDYLKSMDFDGFQTTMNTVKFTQLYDHTFGRQIMTCVLFFIPRSIWTDKGDSSGQLVARSLGYKFTNLSSPLPAELYLDFSFAGVIIGGIFVGYIYRRLDYLCAAAIDYGKPNMHLIIVAILTAFTIIIMRGSLYAVTNIFAPLAILIFLLLKAPAITQFFFTGNVSRSARPPLQSR